MNIKFDYIINGRPIMYMGTETLSWQYYRCGLLMVITGLFFYFGVGEVRGS